LIFTPPSKRPRKAALLRAINENEGMTIIIVEQNTPFPGPPPRMRGRHEGVL